MPEFPDYVIPLAMTPDASVIFGYGYSNEAGLSAAWIWDAANGTRNLQTVLQTQYGLDLSDWRLGRASGISADGRTIVGDGTRVENGGGSESWIAFLGGAGEIPGDLDGDGDVDLSDLAVLLANFGRSGG